MGEPIFYKNLSEKEFKKHLSSQRYEQLKFLKKYIYKNVPEDNSHKILLNKELQYRENLFKENKNTID